MDKKFDKRYLDSFLSKELISFPVEKATIKAFAKCGVVTVKDLLLFNLYDIEQHVLQYPTKVRDSALALYKKVEKKRNIILSKINNDMNSESDDRLKITTVYSSNNNSHLPEIFPETNKNTSPPSAASVRRTGNLSDDVNINATEHIFNSIEEIKKLPLGLYEKKDNFEQIIKSGDIFLPTDETGLRRHLLICGATGSGKSVAARHIIEQAAMAGTPSIVVDAQGDLSSLVIQLDHFDESSSFKAAQEILKREDREREELRDAIKKHLAAIKHNWDIYKYYKKICFPRIFTPGRADVALGLSIPPYSDVLSHTISADNNSSLNEDLKILLGEEASNIARLLPNLNKKYLKWYEEIIQDIFFHAHSNNVTLSGRKGLDELIALVGQVEKISPEHCNDIPPKDINAFKMSFKSFTFRKEVKWFMGMPLDIQRLIKKTADGRIPINVINICGLSSDDKKRVLRHLIISIYKFALNHPKSNGNPSLLLYIDEIARGYGERSVGQPEADTQYPVYYALHQLVSQARKYGVSVMLASQGIIEFTPQLRDQLTTKIIGKMASRHDQNRVVNAIAPDGTLSDSRNYVARVLPGLSQPKLLFIDTKGKPQEYIQHKCASLDIVMTEEEVKSWKDLYRDNYAMKKRDLTALFLRGNFNDALLLADDLIQESKYFDVQPDLNIALPIRGRILLKTMEIEKALNVYEEIKADCGFRSEEHFNFLIDIIDFFLSSGDMEYFEKYIGDNEKLIKDKRPSLYFEYQLRLGKNKLFHERTTSEAIRHFETLQGAGDKKLSLFGQIWKRTSVLFSGWPFIGKFLTETSKSDGRLIEYDEKDGGVIVNELSDNYSDINEPVKYDSEIRSDANIFSLLPVPMERVRQDKPILFHQQQIEISRQCDSLDKAREFDRKGKTIDAMQEYASYINKRGALTQEIVEEIGRFERKHETKIIFLEKWLDGIDWRKFELEIANLYMRMGFKAWATKPSGDGGVDVRAIKNHKTYAIQCKHYKSGLVKIDQVKALFATKKQEKADHAIMVTSSQLERGAKEWAERYDVQVVERRDLLLLLNEYMLNAQPQKPLETSHRKSSGQKATFKSGISPKIITSRSIDDEAAEITADKNDKKNDYSIFQNVFGREQLLGERRTASKKSMSSIIHEKKSPKNSPIRQREIEQIDWVKECNDHKTFIPKMKINDALNMETAQIRRSIMSVLNTRPSGSFKKNDLPKLILKKLGVKTHGEPLRKFARIVNKSLSYLANQDRVRIYKTEKNTRIKLV